MKRTLILGLSSCLLASASGCATDAPTGDDVQLPGDKDDNTNAGGEGKADAWDYTNDPRRLANNLNYVLDELPREGHMEKPVWADRYEELPGDVPVWAASYWPTAYGSTNTRWQGNAIKSPLEKYDEAENGAAGCEVMPEKRCGDGIKAEWDQYLSCAGPAAKWQATEFQSAREMYNGIDDNSDGSVDECYSDHDGIATWWGLCHAWAPASLLEPEPQHAVTYNGVRFEVSDIKALLMTVYDSTNATMLGGRCNAEEIDHDDIGRASRDECRDVNPGALHVVVTNFLGLNDNALVEDRTTNYEVWNQPMEGYEITKQDEVDAARAMDCIGADGDNYTFNNKAEKLFEVKMTTNYITEGHESATPLGMSSYIRHDRYHYILEVDRRGKVIGGEYCASSKDHHPDFMWAPSGIGSSWRRNRFVDLEKVRTLLRLSRAPETTTDPDSGEGTSFENTESADIPDNDATGVTRNIIVADEMTFSTLSVTVDITHSWRGDLVVELLRDGTLVETLHNRSGSSADDIHDTYTVSADDAGTTSTAATWTLRVSDRANADTGTVDTFRLTFLH